MLDSYRNQILRCLRCGFCFDYSWLGQYRMCPVYDVMGFESYGAKGKLIALQALLEGKIEVNESLARHIYACCDCGACTYNCMMSINIDTILKESKKYLLGKGFLPSKYKKLISNLKAYGNISGTSKLSIQTPSNTDIIYFRGCLYSTHLSSIAEIQVEILSKAGLKVGLLEGEVCCGYPALALGDENLARELAKRNLTLLERLKGKLIVFPCPGCYKMFRDEYPRLLNSYMPNMIHFTELLENLIDTGRLTLGKLETSVTFHDPCHLGRGLGIYEPPRRIIESIKGVKLIEMDRSRAWSYCCGGGSALPQAFPKLSRKIARERIREATNTGAEIVATACPSCLLSLRSAAKGDIKVKDISELIQDSIEKG